MCSGSGQRPGVEELRAQERARREQRSRARSRGELPPLQASRRSPLSEGTLVPSAEGLVEQSVVVEVPSRGISPRLRAVLARLNIDADVEPLAEAALAVIRTLTPLGGVRALVDLTGAGLELLDERMLVRAEALAADRLPLPPVDATEGEAQTEKESVDDRWRLHLETQAVGQRALLSPRAWQRLATRLPLPIVDDLVDAGQFNSRDFSAALRGDTDRALYLRARITPAQLTDDELDRLGWHDELCRRALVSGGSLPPSGDGLDAWRFRAALRNGDASVITDLSPGQHSSLPSDLQRLVGYLKAVRAGATVPKELLNDRGLWCLLEQFLPSDRLVDGSAPFHRWAGVRRMHQLLLDGHRLMHSAADDADLLVKQAVEQAVVLRNHGAGSLWAGRADREARNVLAYLRFLCAGPADGHHLEHGISLLEDVARRRDGTPRVVRDRVRRNIDVLNGLRTTRKPREVLNPYLACGVEHRAPEWRGAWSGLRRTLAGEALEAVNDAKDRIQRQETAERKGSRVTLFFALPLEPRHWRLPQDRSLVLEPPARPMRRRSAPSTEAEREWTAVIVATDIVSAARAPR